MKDPSHNLVTYRQIFYLLFVKIKSERDGIAEKLAAGRDTGETHLMFKNGRKKMGKLRLVTWHGRAYLPLPKSKTGRSQPQGREQ